MGFNDIVGHEKQKRMLLSVLEKERLPHAFLFAGPEGIGKKKMARAFAQHILCNTRTGCGACRSCIKAERGSHPDMLIIESEDSIGIDQSRSIGKEVYEHPYESDRRVIIIDRADTMTHEGTNALLKTLEEPPPFNIFFLVTSSERDIPLTIRSRCAKVGFGPLARQSLKDYFHRTTGMDDKGVELISHIALGSIGSGLFWMEQENLLLRRKLAELVLGKHKGFLHVTLMSEQITKSNKNLAMFLSFLLSLFRDMSVVGTCREASMVINRDVKELLETHPVDLKWVAASMKRIQETVAILRYNINRLLAVETLLMNIMERV